MSDERIGTLEEEAINRRRKLAALRRNVQEGSRSDSKEKTPLPKPIFRSYTPQDENLKENKLPTIGPMPIEESEPIERQEPLVHEVELSNLAPRKIDWDLKRNVAKKLEKLERRTQRAIAELIRERLKAMQEEMNEK